MKAHGWVAVEKTTGEITAGAPEKKNLFPAGRYLVQIELEFDEKALSPFPPPPQEERG